MSYELKMMESAAIIINIIDEFYVIRNLLNYRVVWKWFVQRKSFSTVVSR